MTPLLDRSTNPVVLLIDADADDALLILDALDRTGMNVQLDTLADEVELVDYLRGTGRFSCRGPTRPDLVLVDLGMPALEGVAMIHEIKCHHELRPVPLVALGRSELDCDIFRAFEAGAAAYHTKPQRFEQLVGLVTILSVYWFGTSTLPMRHPALDPTISLDGAGGGDIIDLDLRQPLPMSPPVQPEDADSDPPATDDRSEPIERPATSGQPTLRQSPPPPKPDAPTTSALPSSGDTSLRP